MSKTVDSWRFLDPISKRAMRRWAELPAETQVPWTPLARPLSECTVSLVSSAALSAKSDTPFDIGIERRDPWFADPSCRLLPSTLRTGSVDVSHLHINPAFAERDLNSVLPLEWLQDLAASREIASVAPTHYSYIGYTLRPQTLLRETVPQIVRRLREEHVDVVVLVPV